MTGRLIAIEGIDGAGGETQSKLLFEHLKEKGIPAVRLTYPDYSGPIGRLLHEYLHEKFELSPEMQFLLYASDYIKDQEKIRELLEEGKTVVCDRYFTSALAYQGLRGFPIEKALKFADMFGIRRPDTIIFLRVSPETSMKRKYGEKKSLDRNESNKEFLGRVSKFYEGLIKNQTFGKWVIVDSEKPIEKVFEEIRKALAL